MCASAPQIPDLKNKRSIGPPNGRGRRPRTWGPQEAIGCRRSLAGGRLADDHVPVELPPAASRLQFGNVTLVPDERLLLRDGHLVPLTPKAFDLLLVLAANPGRLLSKEQLMQAVWTDTAVEESNLSYHVFAIRKAIGDTAENGHLIETVPKRGYRFTAKVTPLDQRRPGQSGQSAMDDAAASSVPEAAPGRSFPSTNQDTAVLEDDVSRARRGATAASSVPARWRQALWFAAGVSSAAAVALLVISGRRAELPALVRAQVSPGVQLSAASPFALSPDGRQLVFAGHGQDGVSRLWLRRMEDEAARPLSGTETALGGLTPPMFWSPDGQTIAFDGAGQLKGFHLPTGATRTLCGPLPTLAVGGSWSADGTILIGQPSGGLLRCSLGDGRVSETTTLDASNGETAHVFPWFLPDGQHFLYLRVARRAPEGSGVYLGALADRPGSPRPERLVASGFGASYLRPEAGDVGSVVFLREGTLFAQAFDARALRLTGEPVILAGPVGSFLDGGFFAVSQNDVIAFRPPEQNVQLTWFDRQGKTLGMVAETGRYSGVSISPDDSRIAVAKEVVGATIDQDLWVLETSRPTTSRVTFDPLLEDAPVWSSDARRLMFTIDGDTGTLFEHPVDGPANPRMLVEKTPSQHGPDERLARRSVPSLHRPEQRPIALRRLGPPIEGRAQCVSAHPSRFRAGRRTVFARRAVGRVRLERVGALGSARTTIQGIGGHTVGRVEHGHAGCLHRRWQGAAMARGRKGAVLHRTGRHRDGGRRADGGDALGRSAACAVPRRRLAGRLGRGQGWFAFPHRDPGWRRHFRALHDLVEPPAPPSRVFPTVSVPTKSIAWKGATGDASRSGARKLVRTPCPMRRSPPRCPSS